MCDIERFGGLWRAIGCNGKKHTRQYIVDLLIHLTDPCRVEYFRALSKQPEQQHQHKQALAECVVLSMNKAAFASCAIVL